MSAGYRRRGRTICEDFVDQAHTAWNWIRYSILTRIPISEESITDFSLLNLGLKHPHEIITRKINRRQESVEGADWEWWLTDERSWLGLLVQAKKIGSRRLEYRGIGKTDKNGRMQIDVLIQSALQSVPKRIPLYVFYNYWDQRRFDPSWLCGTYQKSVGMLGCGVSHAAAVRQVLLAGSTRLHDLSKSIYPWSCLVCCTGYSDETSNLPSRAFDFLSNSFGPYDEAEYGPEMRSRFISKEVPSYVRTILGGEPLSEEERNLTKARRVTIIREKSTWT